MSITVLAAGDHFVLPQFLDEELSDALAGAGLDIQQLQLPWPHAT